MAVVENIIYKVETEGADKFKKDLQDAAKSQQELTNAVESGTTSVKEYNKAMDARKAQLAQLDKESKAYKELDAEIKASELSVESLNKSTDTLKKQFADTKKAIDGVNYTMNELEKAGLKNTSTYQNLKAKLGELEKQGGELKDQMGDLNTKFKNLGSDTRGIDATIQGVQGIVAVTEIAAGTQALFGTKSKELEQTLIKLNGIMALANGLQQIQNLMQKESAISTALASASQATYGFVVGESTGALKLFRIALASTGIGLLVIGLGALVANWSSFTKAMKESFPALESVGKFFDNFKSKAMGAISGTIESFKVVGEIIYDVLSLNWDELKKDYSQAGKRISNAYTESYNKSLKEETLKNSIEQRKQQIAILEAQGKDVNSMRLKLLKDELMLLEKGSEEYNAKLVEIEKLRTEINKVAKEKRLKEAEEEFNRLNAINTNRQNQEREQDRIRLENLYKFYEQKRKAQEEANKKFHDDEVKAYDNLLAEDERYIEELKQLYKQEELFASDKAQSKLDNEGDVLERSLELNQIQQDKLFELFTKGAINKEQYEQKNTELTKKESDLRYEIEKNNLDKIDQKMQESANFRQEIMNLNTEIQKAAFELNAQYIANQLQTEIDSINTKREYELNNENLTERDKKAINDKYKALEGEAKLKAWKSEQSAKEAQAIMNGALAATNIFANSVPPAWPFLLGAVLLQTAAQVALIKNQKPPKFEKGGSVAKRLGLINGKPHSAGGEVIEVEGNEFVFRKEAVKKYGVSMLEQMNNLQLSIPKEPSRAVAINYNKLGEVIGDKLKENPMLRVSIDKRGVNTSIGGTQIMNNYVDF
jgi:hypothetical protein